MDDLIVTIETDKVAVEIRAPESGVLKETFANEGDNVTVGANLYSIDVNATAPAEPAKPAQTTPSAPPPSASKEPVQKASEVPTPAKEKSAPTPTPTPKEAPKSASSGPVVSSGKREEHRVENITFYFCFIYFKY